MCSTCLFDLSEEFEFGQLIGNDTRRVHKRTFFADKETAANRGGKTENFTEQRLER